MQSITLAAGFQENGWQVRLVTLRPGGELFEKAERMDITLQPLQPFDFKLNWLHPGLFGVVEAFDPDAVLLMGRNSNCLGRKICEKFPGLAVFGTFRTGRRIPRPYLETLKNCRHIFANSLWAAGRLDKMGIPVSGFSVIPNGIVHPINYSSKDHLRQETRKQLKTPETATVFLTTAAFVKGKNHGELLRIFSRLEGAWELWLVGTGPTRKACNKLATNLHFQGNVRFLGHISELSGIYFGADVAVLTSIEESLPNFLLEAQVAGLPVVAYECAGVSEAFLPGESGILVPQGEQAVFLNSLESLQKNTGLRRAMGEKGRIWAKLQFCASDRLQDYMHKIEEIVRQPRPPARP